MLSTAVRVATHRFMVRLHHLHEELLLRAALKAYRRTSCLDFHTLVHFFRAVAVFPYFPFFSQILECEAFQTFCPPLNFPNSGNVSNSSCFSWEKKKKN